MLTNSAGGEKWKNLFLKLRVMKFWVKFKLTPFIAIHKRSHDSRYNCRDKIENKKTSHAFPWIITALAILQSSERACKGKLPPDILIIFLVSFTTNYLWHLPAYRNSHKFDSTISKPWKSTFLKKNTARCVEHLLIQTLYVKTIQNRRT